MLIISKAQLTALSADLNERFVGLMLAHLHQHFPERAAAIGEPGLRTLIADGMRIATDFGIAAEQDVAGLIHFMLDAAPDFVQQPRFAWAVDLLKGASLEPTERIDALFEGWAERREAAGDGAS